MIIIIIYYIPAAEDEDEEKTVGDKEEGSIQQMQICADTLASTSLRSIVKAILKIETAQG